MIRRQALLWLAALGLSACGLQDFCVNIGSGCPPAKPGAVVPQEEHAAQPQEKRGEP